jgi:hypothetical protein
MHIAGLGILSEALTDPGHGSIHEKKTGAGRSSCPACLITIQTKHSTLAIENPFADGHHALSQEVLKTLDKYGKLQHSYGPYKEAAAYPVLDACRSLLPQQI